LKVLLVIDGFIHPPLFGRLAVQRALKQLDGYAFSHVRSLEQLPARLDQLDAFVLYFHHKRLSDWALAALEEFVSNGGGLLGIHSATASFKQTHHYFEILGGRFTGHGAVEPIEVQPAGSLDEPFRDLPGFTVKDELYLHEIQPGVKIHFEAPHGGALVPVVWTHRYGTGKVCYAVPGHRAATMRNPHYQEILKRGLAWVCRS
jgi:type 1 glutamine amidotransferase